MENSESVRVKLVGGNLVEKREREVRKYSRDQLFELAKCIENYELIADDLESMRHADWTKYELDTLPDERLLSGNFMSRQSSELAERDLDQLANNQQRKLYRMSSSPSMKSSKMHDLGQAPVSGQARAKYARLIETMTNGAGGALRAPLRQPLGHHTNSQTRAPPERPGQLFGPLRRQHTHEAAPTNGPNEPMSLPYSINISGRPRDSRWSRASEDEVDSTQNSLLDDETPIKRIGGSEANEQDDDDFDITSLLSITVLSDIRTIRQDLHTFGRHTSQVGASSARPALARSKSYEPASRMPTRSKTALDFNYEPRQPHRPTPQQQLAAVVGGEQSHHSLPPAQYFQGARQQPVASYSQAPYQTAPSSQLAHNWRSGAAVAPSPGLFVCAEMAPPASASKPLQSAKPKPVDESVAKIIESFKAQVRARAADEAPISAAAAPAPAPPQETTPEAATPQAAQTARPNSKSPDGQINDAAANESRSNGGIGASAPRSPAKSAAEPETGTPGKLDNEAGGQHASNKSRGSHIPRLIALQQRGSGKSNQNAATCKVTLAQDAQKDAKPAASASAAPAKFVSQYKRLRGKSLADEVAECKSSA